jgi:hypothetical protein
MRTRVIIRVLAVAAVIALSGVGVVGFGPSASGAVAGPAKPYDFNGDGFVDVAVGSPYGNIGTVKKAGFVTIVYGSSSGLNAGKHQFFGQNSPYVPGTAEVDDHFGYSLASADFDRDGYADLAIGVPDEDNAKGANVGTVDILWGSPAGLVVDPMIASLDGPDPVRPNDRWGESLSAGDIEHDGAAELFVTIPGVRGFAWQAWGPRPGTAAAGARGRLPGASKIMHLSAAEKVARADGAAGRIGVPAGPGFVNSWLATGDITGDGLDDVAWGWRGVDPVENPEDQGFAVLPGIITDGRGDLDEVHSAEVIGVAVSSVAVGDFEGDGFADVGIGQSSDVHHAGGGVVVYKGAASVESFLAVYGIDQETPSVPGAGEAGDAFGASLAAGDINHDGKADLAVGAPTEDVNAVADGGAAFVLFGSGTGLTGTGAQAITQNTAGVPGGAEPGDKSGYQVTLLDNNKDGRADLTVGAPGENGGDGVITLLKGTASGVTGAGSIAIYAPTLGVKGKKAELGRRLGRLG